MVSAGASRRSPSNDPNYHSYSNPTYICSLAATPHTYGIDAANSESAMRLLSLLIATFFLAAMPAVAQSKLPPNVPLKIRLEFRIKPEELNELRGVLTQFAKDEQLTVNDTSGQVIGRGGRKLFFLQLYPENGSIKVTVTNIRAEERMFVWFYEYRAGSNLAEIDTKLEHLLREKWPTLAPYEGS
jgi:hypothetical protein